MFQVFYKIKINKLFTPAINKFINKYYNIPKDYKPSKIGTRNKSADKSFFELIYLWSSGIWMDKSCVMNHSLFYFKTTAVKLILKLYLYLFFFTVINDSLAEWPDCGIVWYPEKPINYLRKVDQKLVFMFKIWKTTRLL